MVDSAIMPKRSSTKSGKQDLNQRAFAIVQALTGEDSLPATAEDARLAVMREMGSRGGKKGSLVTNANMSPDDKKQRAKKGAQARWGKKS